MEFTFGIITSGMNDTLLEKVVQSIHNQSISTYEIIIVGNTNLKFDNCIHVPFDESIKPAWITKKKNIISTMANYENIVLLHDYVCLIDGWYKGFLEFGNDYQVCTTKIIQVNGDRYIDYFLSPHGDAFKSYIPKQRMLPYDFKLTPQLSKLCYLSGTYYCIKKHIALEYPLNEKLSWCQAEDIELFQRLGLNGIVIKCNSNSTVQLLKAKDGHDWNTLVSEEEINILNNLSNDQCNEIFTKLENHLHYFFSLIGITL